MGVGRGRTPVAPGGQHHCGAKSRCLANVGTILATLLCRSGCQLLYEDIITVEQSPGVVANLGTILATGGGGFLMGGPLGALVGVVAAAPALIVVSLVKGAATGTERPAEKVAEEVVVEAWLRRVLRRLNEPDDGAPPS